MALDIRSNRQGTDDDHRTTGSGAVAPGKRTLVEGASGGTPAVVQRKADPAAEGNTQAAGTQNAVEGGASTQSAGNLAANALPAGGAAVAAAGGDTAAPAAADTRVLSGSAWCAEYPTGTTIAELTDATFRANVQAFHDAMVAAATADNNLSISISASYRPPERAHLMHYAYRVYKGTTTPAAANTASAAAGININWDHGNLATSKAKAGEMVTTYDIAYAPALNSRHTEGKAIDWTISWSGSLMIAKKDETTKLDCTGGGAASANLHKVGKSYGVHKLAGDPPHWSSDGA